MDEQYELLKSLSRTVIVATAVAVGLYYFLQQNSGGGRFQTTEPLVVDDDERRRRREHLAKVAEERVNLLQVETPSVAVKCKERKQINLTIIQSSKTTSSSNIDVEDKRPQNATEEELANDSNSPETTDKSQAIDLTKASLIISGANTSCAYDATVKENASSAQPASDDTTANNNDACSNASLEHATKPMSLVETATTTKELEPINPIVIEDVPKVKNLCERNHNLM